jgi:Ras-related protein Rab-2A
MIKIDDNFNIKMTIWDTAGQESFKSIIKSYYRNSSSVFLVYDITKYHIFKCSKESFESLNGWLSEAQENAPQNVMVVLVGTHLD